jgi:muramoyltetrapeptide carboxypeptidase
MHIGEPALSLYSRESEMNSSATVAPPVKIGDRVAIVAPAGPVSLDFLEAGVAILESW